MTHSIREALAAFRRAPLLTGLSAAMVGLALFVVGLFTLAAYNLRLELEKVEERVEIVAYLRENADPAQVTLTTQELRSIPEVMSVRLVTKTEALRVARREFPAFEDVFSDLDVNPLPASLEIRLHPGNQSPMILDRVAAQAERYELIEDVDFGREWVEKLFTLRRIGGITVGVLGGAFAVVAALIIGTAVRIAIFARREEIKVMQLVGARDGFIRRPFLIEGAITGFAGGVLAVGLTYATYRAVFHYVLSIEWMPMSWVGIGLLAGSAFGMVASSIAVHHHLKEVGV